MHPVRIVRDASFVPHRDFDPDWPWLRRAIRGSFYVLPVAAGLVITKACGLLLVPHVGISRVNVKNVNKKQCALCPGGGMVPSNAAGAMLVGHQDGKMASKVCSRRVQWCASRLAGRSGHI